MAAFYEQDKEYYNTALPETGMTRSMVYKYSRGSEDVMSVCVLGNNAFWTRR